MDFYKSYNLIKKSVQSELDSVEKNLEKNFDNKTKLDDYLKSIIFSSAKRIRPLMSLLYIKSLGKDVTSNQLKYLEAVELVHNATLIHDDIIDNSLERRGKSTINSIFDKNLAVVSGDYILSLAIEKIIELNNSKVLKKSLSGLKNVCIGEINQYFSKNKISTIDDYIKKSADKTAILFEMSLVCALEVENFDEETLSLAKEFAKNFGIAFQIRDDLKNVLEKVSNSDLDEGIYNSAVIYAIEENPKLLECNNIAEEIKKTKGIEKTKALMDNYFGRAKSVILSRENDYAQALQDLIDLLSID